MTGRAGHLVVIQSGKALRESDLSDLVGASHLGVLALDTLLPLSRVKIFTPE